MPSSRLRALCFTSCMAKLGQSDLPYRMLRLTWLKAENQDSFLAVVAAHSVQMYQDLLSIGISDYQDRDQYL